MAAEPAPKRSRLGGDVASSPEVAVEILVVCCGAPLRGMGWYHAQQILDGRVDGARLTQVVEPWLLGEGRETAAGSAFATWSADAAGVAFHTSTASVPRRSAGQPPALALICGRTAENPRHFREVIELGYSHVLLEKPGAPSVRELEAMRAYAESECVTVFMGYMQNFTKYLQSARSVASTTPGASLTLVRGNAYKPEDLEECFARNSEGLLKNMAVHQLAFLVTYFDLRVDTVTEVVLLRDVSAYETRGGIADFSRVGFTIRTSVAGEFTIKADRCAGDQAEAVVVVDGKIIHKASMRNDDFTAKVEALEKARPGLMSYFASFDEEYVTIKRCYCDHILQMTSDKPEGVATLSTGVETLKVAEHLTDLLKKAIRVRPSEV